MHKYCLLVITTLMLLGFSVPYAKAAEEDLGEFIDRLDEEGQGTKDTKPSAVNSELARVEAYLNNITTFVADFMQVAPDGKVSTGTFFLSRPGKLRWQYNPPVPILIVANGKLLTYYDYELDQISHVSPESSLAAFLTRKTIQFAGDVSVRNFRKESGILRITITQTNQPTEGQLTLVLNDYPLQLKKLEVLDSAGQQTSVSFSNIKLGVALSDKLFIVQDPKLFKKRL